MLQQPEVTSWTVNGKSDDRLHDNLAVSSEGQLVCYCRHTVVWGWRGTDFVFIYFSWKISWLDTDTVCVSCTLFTKLTDNLTESSLSTDSLQPIRIEYSPRLWCNFVEVLPLVWVFPFSCWTETRSVTRGISGNFSPFPSTLLISVRCNSGTCFLFFLLLLI